MKFTELKLSNDLIESIGYFNFEELTPIQEHVIPVAFSRKDIMACSQTGSGKTVAFLLPIIELIISKKLKGLQALIICPTRELCMQIEEQITGLAYNAGIHSFPVYGGSDNSDFNQQKNALVEGNTNIIVATPGRLISHLAMDYVNIKNLSFLVLDEADEMLNMGFYDDIIKIISYLPKERQNMLFSATMPAEIKKLANKILQNPAIIDLNKSLPAEQIDQYKYVVKKREKSKLVYEIAKSNKDERIIVFTATKSAVITVSKELSSKGIKCSGINSSFSQNERNSIVQDFKSGKIQVLVATNLLARGIDITNIGLIINYDIPDNPEDYVHRIGRTARAGKKGKAISLVSEYDIVYFVRIEKLLNKTVPVIQLPKNFEKSPEYKQKISYKSKNKYPKNKKNFRKNYRQNRNKNK